ncbi:hypothetical protein WR25_05247 [Diploscapter pachys]|uniref:Uncharacterized protein n=1 Tax=Diploscapter pachys TaxID=2018661 RepID=A0A2A2M4C4_9BILA|nr:hypothetical protein WR25_05247 [Diploscapter pachys]
MIRLQQRGERLQALLTRRGHADMPRTTEQGHGGRLVRQTRWIGAQRCAVQIDTLRLRSHRLGEQARKLRRRRGIGTVKQIQADIRRRATAVGVDGKPRDDLVRDDPRQALQRRILRRDRRIFGLDDVDARVRSCRRVDQDAAVIEIDQLIARAQRPPLACHAVVAPDAEAGDLVVELHVEAIARRIAAIRRQPVAQRIAHQPASLALDRRDLDMRERARDRAASTAAI